MGKGKRKKQTQVHGGQNNGGVLTPSGKVRQWAHVIVGIASLLIAAFAARTGYRRLVEGRMTAAVERQLEVEQAVFQAWDLIGGQPGSLEITEFRHDKSSLELARRQIAKALTLDSDNVPALLAKAAYLRVSGVPEQSIEVLNIVSTLAPTEPVLSVYRALALSDLAKHEEATGHFRRALALDPNNALHYYNLGTALWRAGNLSEARATLKMAVDLNPSRVAAYMNLAAVLREQGNHKEALDIVRAATRVASTDVVVLNNLATVLGDGGELHDALRILDRAVALDPSFALSYYNRGTTLRELDKLEQATADLRLSLEKDPGLFPAYINLIEVLREQGKEEEAQEVMGEAHRFGFLLGSRGIKQVTKR